MGSEITSSPIDVAEEWITFQDENVVASKTLPDIQNPSEGTLIHICSTPGRHNYSRDLPTRNKLLVWVDSDIRDTD